jgi:hypothetical protein
MTKAYSLTLILFLTGFLSKVNAQTSNVDSTLKALKQQVDLHEKAFNMLTENLNRCDREFRNGTTFMLAGLGAGAVGTGLIVFNSSPDGVKSDVPLLIIGAGGLSMIIGTIIMIDSHRWLGDGGALQFKGNALTYRF